MKEKIEIKYRVRYGGIKTGESKEDVVSEGDLAWMLWSPGLVVWDAEICEIKKGMVA